MANSFFIFLAIAAIFIPSILAVDFKVGDDEGWSNTVNYTKWAADKTFYVGDRLIFNYGKGDHNVVKANGTEFKECKALSGQNALITGNDIIPLAKSGRKWYFCGIGDHCESGQKLVITVMDQAPANSPLPGNAAPPPPSAATKVSVSGHFAFMVVVFGILGVIMA